MREVSERYETRENITSQEKHNTFIWKGVWKKEETSRTSLRLLDASMQTHPRGDDSTLSISSQSGDDSDPITESSWIDAVSLTDSSTESEAETRPLQTSRGITICLIKELRFCHL